ncbi:MAG: pilus assembly protein PilZ [Treponema sp.]|jgi:hypothetical protein|nr:pilus assembly protein PilZ [Treponema sp.]
MGVVTSQKISVYYERFKSIDVTFTREIIMVTQLMTNQVYLKCVGDFWPCVIFSTSFEKARIVANICSGLPQKLEKANNMVSLRFCFKDPDTPNPLTFFVTGRVTGSTAYGGSKDVALFSIQFTQRPPDDLIEIMGRILDANVNSAKRREERIPITADSCRRLNLLAKESAVFIEGVPRRCILRDLSFSGAKLIMMGVAKFLVEKEAALRLDFDDPRESFFLRGKFLRSEMVDGRKDLVALAVLFDESLVPMGYKIRLNDFMSQVRAAERSGDSGAAEKKAALKAQAAQAAALQASAATAPAAAESASRKDTPSAASAATPAAPGDAQAPPG